MSQKRSHRRWQAEHKSIPVKRSHSRAVSIVLLVLSVVLGTWFAIAPTLENKRILAQQQRILEAYEARPHSADTTKMSITPDTLPAPATPTVFEPVIESTSNHEPRTIPKNSGNTAIGALEIEQIDLKLPVVEGIDKAQLEVALGHIPETAPIGEVGNAVLAGHRSYAYGRFFNRLGEMKVGDELTYTGEGGEEYTFSVYEILTLAPDDQSAFEQSTEKSVLSLYTCTPTATHRLVVRAERTE